MTRLPAPEQWVLSTMNEMEVAERSNGTSSITPWTTTATTTRYIIRRCS